ncbi:putative endonuclease [Pedobacter psychrotolerans]|uniref:Nuclease n=1 Tax=Pedobacter psychrotolerans TaxID=1843235 RepID=A0A4R2HIL2_9SPHI|nr:GIY-YIG nuclease family protein [Pedobacter psychrotolerans]TCO29151.1 putative endonuclease [Pedobacter psychrotolerans]GGE54575.1 nuclease [Pedobacter psychrotolerans]
MERGGTVYIITNFTHTTFYTGVTSDLLSRMKEHKEKEHSNSFSARYNVNKLVYFCFYSTIEDAIAEEKRIKGGSRLKKIKLIENLNPEWKDLWDEVKEW